MEPVADNDIIFGYKARKAAKAKREQDQTQRLVEAIRSSIPAQSQNFEIDNKISEIVPRFDDLNYKIIQLEKELALANSKLATYEQEQPRVVNAVTQIENKFIHQLKIVRLFIDNELTVNPTGKILNHDLNNALMDFAEEGDVHIESYEVAKLMRHFGFDYSQSNGKSYYRGLEFKSKA